jgi:serine/threonine-protein kinase PpkA
MAEFPEIPGYTIKSKLGEGGTAAVYLGFQKKLKRNVAIKILAPSLLKDEVTRKRFEREAETAANLRHSNIIQIFDTGIINNYYYIIMEYLEESLKDRIGRSPEGKIHPEIALDIVEALMGALDYAHFRGVYHRDIKPANIMFRQDDTPVLVDFGISQSLDPTERLTREGQSIGTTYYMSPEQCKAQKEMDSRSDIYSLGAVLYEMLTGKKPYESQLKVSVALMHIEGPVPRLQEKLSRYQPLIDKMMAKHKNERLQSGAEFKQFIDKILIEAQGYTSKPQESSPSPAEAPPPSQPPASPPPPANEVSKNYSFRKPTKDIKTLCGEYLEMIMKKLRSFWEDLVLTVKNLAIGDYLVRKKLIVGIAAAVILTIMLVVFFSQGKGQNKREVTAPGGNINIGFTPIKPIEIFVKQAPSFIEQVLLLLKDSIFQEKLKLAQQYFEQGFNKKAVELSTELKKIKNTKELTELEKKLTKFIKSEYNRYFNRALYFFKRKQYRNAKINIIQAKEYKNTLELRHLEENVDRHLR